MKLGLVVAGALLVMAGAVGFQWEGRVVATYVLDGVMNAMGPKPPETFDFSSGQMVSGDSLSSLGFTALSAGAVGLGLLLLIPVWLTGHSSGGAQRVLRLVLGLLLGVAAVGTLWLAIQTRMVFGRLAAPGAPDPVAFAESIPVAVWDAARFSLLLAALVVSGISFLAARGPGQKKWTVQRFLLPLAALPFCICCVMVVIFALGPAAGFTRIANATVSDSGPVVDPADMARTISFGVNLLTACVLPLGLAAVLSLVAGILPDSGMEAQQIDR